MKIETPRGVKDFGPEDMIIREWVIETLKNVFRRYGFDALETPALESLKVLTAKSGKEIEKQIFKIEDGEIGLRFDLTVPLARFVASNPQIPKPFKRYAIGPVWRREEPQAGRLRQFYQADIDICGVKSVEADVECIACAVDCLKELGFKNFKIRINNRKVLEGFVEVVRRNYNLGVLDKLSIFRAIDKIEKIGKDKVIEELTKLGLNKQQASFLMKIISSTGSFEKLIEQSEKLLGSIQIGREGLEELKQMYDLSKAYGIDSFMDLDFTLARGLDYYTGPIFEVEAFTKTRVGSIAGGGRYDKLIEIYGGQPTPTTGISLGIERIVEIIKKEGIVELPKTNVKVFIACSTEDVKKEAIKIARDLRKYKIPARLDVSGKDLKRQLEYADSIGVPYVVIVGKKELSEGMLKLKDMRKREEKVVPIEDIPKILGER